MSKQGKCGKVCSQTQKMHYKAYRLENRQQKNKLARLKRTLKRQPDNEQIAQVIATLAG